MNEVYDPFLAGIVRILNKHNGSAGSGFIITLTSSRLFIATCTHVIQQSYPEALALPYTPLVPLLFHIHPSLAPMMASVEITTPDSAQDITILRVEGDIPKRVRPLRVCLTTALEGRPVWTFGYPMTGEIRGAWGNSTYCMLGPRKEGSGQSLLQLESTTISAEFSGAPVWDAARHSVVGMITDVARADSLGRGAQTAYAIPVGTLYECFNDVRVLPTTPFHGGAPFPEADAQHFFGYTETIEEMVHALHSPEKLLAVLGPMGCGKTSVVQAGLLPRLREERIEGFHGCGILVAHLTVSPFEQLQAIGLEGATQNLAESIHSWCQKHHYTRLALVLDPFEDLLQQCPEPLQTHFLDQLVEVVRGHDAAIVLILNDAWYSTLVSHTKLTRLVESHLVNVIVPAITALLKESLHKRIEQYGITLSPQLTEQLVHKVANMQARTGDTQQSLIAQYELLLTQLWQQIPKNKNSIDVTDISFQSLQGDINDWAEKLFLRLSVQEQAFVKRTVLQLLEPSNTRHTPSETLRAVPLLPLCQNEEDVELLYTLSDQGLLALERDIQTHEEQITIAQKLLLEQWTRLKEWVTEERQFQSWQHVIDQKASSGTSSASPLDTQEQSSFLTALELQEANVWLERRSGDVPAHIQTFLAQQKQTYEEQQTQSRIHEENEQQRRLARARQLAAQANKLREDGNLDASVLLAVEAMRQTMCVEAYQVLSKSIALLPRLEGIYFHNYNAVHFAIFSPNGCYFATATLNGIVWIRDISVGGTLCIQFRTNTPIYALAFSSDGTYLVTVGDNEEVIIWKTKSGRQHTVLSHKGRIHAAAFSPTVPWLVATASDDGTIGVWEVTDDGKQLLFLLPHKEPMKTVLFSPSGQFLTTASGLNVYVYSVESGKALHSLQHTRSIRTVTISPDGLLIAILDGTSSVLLWEWKNEQKGWKRKKEPVVSYLYHEQPIHSVTFSSDGLLLATVCGNVVTLWDRVNCLEQRRIIHEAVVTGVAFNNIGTLLATASRDGTAHLWETSGAMEYLHVTHQQSVNVVAFSPNGHFLLTGSDDGSAKLWRTTRGGQVARIHHPNGAKVLACTATGETDYTLATAGEDDCVQLTYFTKNSFHFGARFPHDKQVRAVAWNPTGAYLATGSDDDHAQVWRVIDESVHLTIQHRGSVHAVAWSSTGDYVVSASEDGTAQVWNVATRQRQIMITHHAPIYTVAFHPARPLVATGSLNGWVALWTYEQGEESQMLAYVQYEGSINKVVFSPDGRLLASASDDGNVRVWTWEGGKQQFLLLSHDEPVYALAFSRDGLYLASASSDGTVKIWETTTGRMLAYFSHTQEVWAVSFSSDGNYLATASSDRTARVWEKASGQQIASFPHSKSVYDVGLSPDGKHIVTASGDGTASVWLWQPEDIIAEACQLLRRNLTREEWQRYMGDVPYHQMCREALWRGLDSFSDA